MRDDKEQGGGVGEADDSDAENSIEEVMYRTVLNNDPMRDANKSQAQISNEVYHHTEVKNDVNRNMLATLYVRDPHKFNENDEEVQKVLSNNIGWPKGYVPEEHPVVKPPPKMTSEELHYLKLADKHYVRMRPLNKYYLDDEIVDLPKLSQTSNAFGTYKEHGWKARLK